MTANVDPCFYILTNLLKKKKVQLLSTISKTSARVSTHFQTQENICGFIVFEHFPTKKISLNYHFNNFSELKYCFWYGM